MSEKDGSDQVPKKPTRVASTQERGGPYRSGRVVTQPDRFIGLGEIPVVLKRIPETTMNPSKTRMPHFGKKQ